MQTQCHWCSQQIFFIMFRFSWHSQVALFLQSMLSSYFTTWFVIYSDKTDSMIHFVYWILIAASFGFIEAIMFHVADYNKLKKFNKQYKDIHVFFYPAKDNDIHCYVPIIQTHGFACHSLHDGFSFFSWWRLLLHAK